MASHSSILAWKSPWTEEPGGLQSMGLHDWACVHGGGRWVGSNKLGELEKKIIYYVCLCFKTSNELARNSYLSTLSHCWLHSASDMSIVSRMTSICSGRKDGLVMPFAHFPRHQIHRPLSVFQGLGVCLIWLNHIGGTGRIQINKAEAVLWQSHSLFLEETLAFVLGAAKNDLGCWKCTSTWLGLDSFMQGKEMVWDVADTRRIT